MQEIITLLAIIGRKDLHELDQHDIYFLNARASYLTDEQREKFASVLTEEVEKKPKK